MLKQLILESQIKEKRKALEGYQEKRNDIDKQILKLRESLEEAKTEEEISFVREEITKLEGENEELNLTEKINNVENEIKALEEELSDIEERTKTKEDKKEPEKVRSEEMNRLQVRELIKNGSYYERAEVKEFYNKIKNFRAVSGEGLTIPNIVVNRIMDILGDYSTIYPLVDKISVQGTARILLDTDTEPATWIEMAGAIPTGDVGTIINVDFDGFKVGKATFIDNCMLQDSIINLDNYVTKKIARSLALALDKAILLGEGSSSKQPEGIIPKLPSGQKVTVDEGPYINVAKQIALIDTGKDSVGEIICVMNRKTYYNMFLEYTINVNSSGNVVGKLPNLAVPDFLGLRVVFNNFMPENQVLFGDFSKYTLVERENITIDKSEHYKFLDDKMTFLGKGRFDGKPTNNKAFALVTIEPAGE